MTIVAIDGFDLYNGVLTNTGLQSKWAIVGGSAPTLVAGRFGGQSVQLNASTSNNSNVTRSLPGSYSSVSIGAAFRSATLIDLTGTGISDNWIFALKEGAAYHVGLHLGETGILSAYRLTSATAGTLLGASAGPVITPNTWHYIEIEVTIHDSTGVFKVYVDGGQVINLTAQDTRNAATGVVNVIELYLGDVDNSNPDWSYDDLYVTDTATKLGECKVETCRPTADVSGATDFTPSTGSSHFALVDETTCNGDTDYNSGSTVGHKDRFTHAGLSTTPATIHAVQVTAFAQKTDATSRSIALQVKSGATTSDGANFALAVGYGKLDRIMETDPNTAAAWAVSPVNALEFGAKVTV